MKFHYGSGHRLDGELIYRHSGYSIDFMPSVEGFGGYSGRGTGSILIDTLQLEVCADTGRVLFPWGLFPYTKWRKADIFVPESTSGELFLDDVSSVVVGAGVGLPGAEEWLVRFDDQSGWICVGSGDKAGNFIEFATNVVASLNDGRLTGLWLKPLRV
ncbi:hypothetical protein [Frateuria defendens]|uniref:hypothetical protein n=1 Tax=Frateuria defendens TaxID=2219559 RepID=UPI0012934BDA|nr:hypothetical protein [Frateuria defendens]